MSQGDRNDAFAGNGTAFAGVAARSGRSFAPEMPRLLAAYIAIGGLTAAGMTLSNIFISRLPAEQVVASLLGMLAGYPPLIALLWWWTRRQLGLAASNPDQNVRKQQWLRLTRLPTEIMWIVLSYGVLATQLFQWIVVTKYVHGSFGTPWLHYAKSTIFNVTAFMGCALIHYGAARWVLREALERLRMTALHGERFVSLRRPILLFFGCALIFAELRLLWYGLEGSLPGLSIRPSIPLLTGLLALLIGFIVFALLASMFFRDLDRMTVRLAELAALKGQNPHERIRIASYYETGELAFVYNRLQERLEREYAELNKELELARTVQRRLLPKQEAAFGPLRVCGYCRRAFAVGGGLYDMLRLDNGSTAVMAGNARGEGMSAALIMTAILALFRAHMQELGSPGAMLAAIRAVLRDMSPEPLRIDLAILVWSPDAAKVTFSAHGDMALRRLGAAGSESDLYRLQPGGGSSDIPERTVQLPPEGFLLVHNDRNAHDDDDELAARFDAAPAPNEPWLDYLERLTHRSALDPENAGVDKVALLAGWGYGGGSDE